MDMRSPSGTMEVVTVVCISVRIFTMMRFIQTVSLDVTSKRGLYCYLNSSWCTNSSAKRFGRHQESCTSTYEALFGPGSSLDKVLWKEKNSTYGIWGMGVVPVYMFILQNNVLLRLTTSIWLIVTQLISHWVCHHQVHRNWICTNQRCKDWVERR